MSGKYADKTIDLRGLHGTDVEIRTKVEIDRLAVGERLNVLYDDSQSEDVISRYVTRSGHEIISSVGSVGREFQILIEKK
jgi:tRNA 2-thiouridine synthesizing protein A